jgi:hypothetical protein
MNVVLEGGNIVELDMIVFLIYIEPNVAGFWAFIISH